MIPKLFAFDLDGTLLNSEKKLTPANARALHEMAESGAIVAFASGRLGSSMRQYEPELGIDLAMLTLNGAAVYTGSRHGSRLVFDAPLPCEFADHLIGHAQGKPFALNYYINDRLHTIRNDVTGRWIDLYFSQTHTKYHYVDDLASFSGQSPSKIIFVGDPHDIDEQEAAFRARWDGQVYICRTWDYYLEFLNIRANKGNGIGALADAYGIPLAQVAAFGDANNDIPMLEKAGLGIAMQNAPDSVKCRATRISPWTNDQDGVAREWDRLKTLSAGQ